MRSRLLSRPQPLILAALVLLLLLLALLQYRWIGQVSRLERQRMLALLDSSGTRFAEDFDREVTRAFLYFHPDPSDEVRERTVRQAERWQAEAPYPDLVRDVFLVQRGEAGAPGDLGDLSIEVLTLTDPVFRPVAWPAELQGLRRELAEETASNAALRVVAPDLPGLVIPSNWPVRLHRGLAMSPGDSPPDREYLILRLDRRVLSEEIFPALTQRHFGGPRGLDFAVAVVSADDPSRLIFRSDSEIPAEAFRSGDVELGMFGLRPFDELRSFWRGRGLWNRRRTGTWIAAPHAHPPAERQEARRDRLAQRFHGMLRHGDTTPPEMEDAPWRLVVINGSRRGRSKVHPCWPETS